MPAQQPLEDLTALVWPMGNTQMLKIVKHFTNAAMATLISTIAPLD
jgi:hypothetical protein